MCYGKSLNYCQLEYYSELRKFKGEVKVIFLIGKMFILGWLISVSSSYIIPTLGCKSPECNNLLVLAFFFILNMRFCCI